MRFAICTLLANRAFCSDRHPELRMGYCGLIVYRTLLLRTASIVQPSYQAA